MMVAPEIRVIAEAIRSVDEAGLLAESDVQTMSEKATAGLRHLTAAAQVLRVPGRLCPACGLVAPEQKGKLVQALILGVDGLSRRLHMPVRCRRATCRLSGVYVYQNFIMLRKGEHEWSWREKRLPQVVAICPKFSVTMAWCEQFGRRLVTQHASFWGEAEVHWYPRCGISKNRLKLRVEESWMKITLIRRLASHQNQGLRGVSLLLHLGHEILLEEAWSDYADHMFRDRVAQVNALEAPLTVAVLDGHQKLTRRCCGVRLMSWQFSEALQMGRFLPCPETPGIGVKLCSHHQCAVVRARAKQSAEPGAAILRSVKTAAAALSACSQSALRLELQNPDRSVLRGDLRISTWPLVEEFLCGKALEDPCTFAGIEEASESNGGAAVDEDLTLAEILALQCKTHKHCTIPAASLSLSRFRRTGGFLVACSSQGLILHLEEFFGSESLPQRYMFLAKLKQAFPDLQVIVHDDACHLRRFADNRSSESSMAASLAHPAIVYVVDRFHARGHVDEWCRQNCCPGVPETDAAIEGVNTSICEITFAWIARYKHIFRKMNRWTGNFFISEMCYGHNARLLGDINQAVVAAIPEQCEGPLQSESESPMLEEVSEETDSSSSSAI